MNRRGIWMIAQIVSEQLRLEPPVSLQSICDAIGRLGGTCIEVEDDFQRPEAKISTPSNGSAERNLFTIEYVSDKPETRILFSIAHELGHLFLHILDGNGRLKPETEYARSLISSKAEIEANEFAAALLMPESKFVEKCEQIVTSDNKVNISELACYFNVSVQAATVRGNILRLW